MVHTKSVVGIVSRLCADCGWYLLEPRAKFFVWLCPMQSQAMTM